MPCCDAPDKYRVKPARDDQRLSQLRVSFFVQELRTLL